MKKIIVLTSVFFALVCIIISCNKSNIKSTLSLDKNGKMMRSNNYSELGLDLTETINPINGINEVTKILTSDYITSNLTLLKKIPSANVSKFQDKISLRYTYSINLLNYNSSNSNNSLLIMPLNHQEHIYQIFLVNKTSINNVDKVNLSVLGRTKNLFDEEPSQASWVNCMQSAWAEITDDLTGSLACALAPSSCIGACLIHCSGILGIASNNPTLQWLCDHGFMLQGCNNYITESNNIYLN